MSFRLNGTHAFVHHCSACYVGALLDVLLEEKQFDFALELHVIASKHIGLDSQTQARGIERIENARQLARAAGN